MMELLATLITAVLTVLSPLGIALAKRESWTQIAKVCIPIIVSLVLAAVYLWIKGQIVLVTPEDWLVTILAIYGAQQLAYTTIMRWWATILEQVGQKPAEPSVAPDVVTIPRTLLEGWHDTPALSGSDWRQFADSLPASEQSTALLSVADALDRTPGPDHRA